jgi:hypothetical protein
MDPVMLAVAKREVAGVPECTLMVDPAVPGALGDVMGKLAGDPSGPIVLELKPYRPMGLALLVDAHFAADNSADDSAIRWRGNRSGQVLLDGLIHRARARPSGTPDHDGGGWWD